MIIVCLFHLLHVVELSLTGSVSELDVPPRAECHSLLLRLLQYVSLLENESASQQSIAEALALCVDCALRMGTYLEAFRRLL